MAIAQNSLGARPRLMFIVADCPFFLSHRLPIAKAALLDGFEVLVACPPDGQTQRLNEYGLRHVPISLSRGSLSPWDEWRAFLQLLLMLKRERPDVVHLVASKPVIYGGLAARLLGIPAVGAISGLGHAFTATGLKGKMLSRIALLGYRLAFRRAKAFAILQNDDDKAILLNGGAISEERFCLIPGSGVDLDAIRPAAFPVGPVTFALPARMLKDKGVVEFVEAARNLKHKGLSAQFQLLGKPDPANPSSVTIEQLQSWNDEGVVSWHGYAEDMNAALAQTHVVVLPSYREGFPKTVIDAAAAGRMSLVSNVPGCRGSIIENETGVFCRVKDASDLAAVMERLAADRVTIERMGKVARKHAEAVFDIKAVCATTLGIYRRLLAA